MSTSVRLAAVARDAVDVDLRFGWAAADWQSVGANGEGEGQINGEEKRTRKRSEVKAEEGGNEDEGEGGSEWDDASEREGQKRNEQRKLV
jgi:hypothetical protein